MNIGPVEIGTGHPCRTVAEVSNNHNGSLERAKRLIQAAKEAGADLVKLQCYTPDELVALRGDGPAPDPWGSDGYTMKALYEKAQTPHAWFPELVQHAKDLEMPWFSSVFGLQSLALLESLDCPAYKISAIDSEDEGLSKWVACTDRPVVRSVREDRKVYDWAADRDEFWMLCPPGYPQEDAQLSTVILCDGYSYHGTSSETPALAALCGAKLVEAHFHLEAEPSELEANVCLNESQFAGMVGRIRHYEGLL